MIPGRSNGLSALCPAKVYVLSAQSARSKSPLDCESLTERRRRNQGPALIHPDRPSIAVLPFVNMSGDRKQNSFADGMAEEIITALSHCSRVFVVAGNSSFAYKGKSVDVRQVGRELGVRYVLEGSIRRGATVFALRESLLMRHREDTSGPIGSKAKWVTRLIFRIALPKVLSPQSSRNFNKPRLSD
jgi:TolB-like protein